MLKSLKIKNFRCFEEFDLPQLGRVNLLVGKNNSGKTSVLEALHVLNSPNNVDSLVDIMEYRGECSWDEKDDMKSFELSHLFTDHQIKNESNFEILGVGLDNKEINFFMVFTSVFLQELTSKISEGKEIEITNLDRNNFADMHYLIKWENPSNQVFLLYFPRDVKLGEFPQLPNNSRLLYLNSSSK